MNRIEGTSARQLDLLDEPEAGRPVFRRPEPQPVGRGIRLLRRDVYAELARRRRRAQIAARHELDRS
jgi:hypothetical protein